MQTIIILNSHYITEGQYVAIIAYITTRTKPAILVIFLVRNLLVVLQWGNKGGEGEGEVGYNIIHYMIVHIRVAACLNETKKGGETSKSKILRVLKRGI